MSTTSFDTTKLLSDLKKKEEASAQQYEKSNIPFMKLGEGKHRLRFLPKGNKQENLPYKLVQVHTLMTMGSNGKRFPNYILCYDWLFTHDGAKENTIQPLIKMKKLMPDDIKAFQEAGGCPICRAFDVMRNGGEDKDIYSTCRARGMSYWNVLNRADKKIYVATLSDTKHKEVCAAIVSGLDLDETTGKPSADSSDILDLETGFDFQCVASGQNLGRRYTYTVIAKPRPVTDEDILEGEKPFNLMTAVAETFKSYGAMCTALREVHGTTLARYGFKYGAAIKDDTKIAGLSIDEDEEDEDIETSNDLKKTKINPLTGNPLVKAPFDFDDDDEEEEGEIPEPPKKSKTNLKVVPPKKASKIFDYDAEEEDDVEEQVKIVKGKLIVDGVNLF